MAKGQVWDLELDLVAPVADRTATAFDPNPTPFQANIPGYTLSFYGSDSMRITGGNSFGLVARYRSIALDDITWSDVSLQVGWRRLVQRWGRTSLSVGVAAGGSRFLARHGRIDDRDSGALTGIGWAFVVSPGVQLFVPVAGPLIATVGVRETIYFGSGVGEGLLSPFTSGLMLSVGVSLLRR